MFKEQTSQSTYNISPWPEAGCAFGDEIRWRNSMMKNQWRKSVTNIQWDLRLLGTYDDIFGTLIIRQRCSAYWVHLWLQSFGALGCCNHILHCVLASQKHPWRIVVARKFEVFRVFDVLCGACRNCIQTALAATDRLGLFLKRGQKVSTYALTCFNHVLEKSSTSESKSFFENFKDFLIRVWTVHECKRNLENSSQTLHLKSTNFILIWGCKFYTFESI